MVQFLSIIFFSWISSIFVGFFKSSRFFVSPCTKCCKTSWSCFVTEREHDRRQKRTDVSSSKGIAGSLTSGLRWEQPKKHIPADVFRTACCISNEVRQCTGVTFEWNWKSACAASNWSRDISQTPVVTSRASEGRAFLWGDNWLSLRNRRYLVSYYVPGA